MFELLKKYVYFFLLLISLPVVAQSDLPEKPDSWVNDYIGLLNSAQKNSIESKLRALQEETSTQIFLAIFDKVPEGYYLEDFSVKLFEKWRPGRAKEQNGVLIVLFHGDREIRIEVGYGLEGSLTDLQAGRVIEDYMIPQFKNGDYFSGLNNGIDVIIAAVKGEYQIPTKNKNNKRDSSNWITVFIIFLILISIFRRRGGGGTTISGGGTRYSRGWGGPVIFGGFGGSRGGSSFGGGGGFSGGFGGLSGGGGASGRW